MNSKFEVEIQGDDSLKESTTDIIFRKVQSFLYNTHISAELLVCIILAVKVKLTTLKEIETRPLDRFCSNPSNSDPNTILNKLFHIVREHHPVSNSNVKLDFLDVLINLDQHEQLSSSIRNKIQEVKGVEIQVISLVSTPVVSSPTKQATHHQIIEVASSSSHLLPETQQTPRTTPIFVRSQTIRVSWIALLATMYLLLLYLLPWVVRSIGNPPTITHLSSNSTLITGPLEVRPITRTLFNDSLMTTPSTSNFRNATQNETLFLDDLEENSTVSKKESTDSILDSGTSPRPPFNLKSMTSLAPSVGASTISQRARKKKPKKLFEVSISSHKDSEGLSFPAEKEISATINSHSPVDWSHGNIFKDAESVDRLQISGRIHVDSLLQVVNQTENIHHLHLNNSENELCSVNQGQLALLRIVPKVHLTNLRALVLEGFTTSCLEVLTLVVEKLEIKRLQGLRFKNGVIDPQNVNLFQGLLSKTKTSQSRLIMQNTEIKMSPAKPLFDRSMIGALPILTNLHVDFIPQTKWNEISALLGPEFCNIVSNLKTFTLENEMLSLAQLSYLYPCKNIIKLQIPIKVPIRRSYFNVSFLGKNFPLLENAEMTLYHQKCAQNSTGSGLRLEGMDSLKKRMKKFTLLSNCRLQLNVTSDREEVYFREKGLYGIKYDIMKKQRTKKNLIM